MKIKRTFSEIIVSRTLSWPSICRTLIRDISMPRFISLILKALFYIVNRTFLTTITLNTRTIIV